MAGTLGCSFSRRPIRGQLRAIRETTALTHAALTQKLGPSRQSYAALENSEARGAISVSSVQSAADENNFTPLLEFARG